MSQAFRDMSNELTAAEQALFDATLSLSEQLDVVQTCEAMLGVIERVFDAQVGSPRRLHPRRLRVSKTNCSSSCI